MDDMYIVCKEREELESIIAGIAAEAKNMGMFVNEKKTHISKLSDTFVFLQDKYSFTETGKVIKRINPNSLTRERRRLKAYKRQMDIGKISYDDIEQSTRSWMGNFVKTMPKKQIQNMNKLYYELFGKELIWKQRKSFSRMVSQSR